MCMLDANNIDTEYEYELSDLIVTQWTQYLIKYANILNAYAKIMSTHWRTLLNRIPKYPK